MQATLPTDPSDEALRRPGLFDWGVGVLFCLLAGIQLLWTAEHPLSSPTLLNAAVHVVIIPVVVLRRVYPVACLLTGYGLLAGLALAFHTAPINLGVSPILLAAPLLLMAVTRHGPSPRWGQAALLVGIMGSYVSPATRLWSGGSQLVVIVLIHSLVLLGCYFWSAQQRSLVDRHAAAMQMLAERSAAESEAATQAERLLVAREVHDVVGHSLAVVRVQAATALAIGDEQTMRAALQAIKEVTGDTMADTRELVGTLRTGPLSPVGDVRMLPALVDHVRTSGFAVVADLPTDDELARWQQEWPARLRLAVTRVTQESLTNVVKHASPGCRVTCRVGLQDGQLLVDVSNGGRREGTAGVGHGLVGLAERIDQVGGQLQHGPQEDGFALHARIPVPPVDEEGQAQ
ncbi:sensor histidine kinase [Luteococcus sp.]|uniref:sensor histidine kinase n=1 Tax=Luteococcus sp. TaxID=1969402 RepID=UPI003736489F